MHYARDVLQPFDVFILPVTITNSGARDAIIVSFDLYVAEATGSTEATGWVRHTSLNTGTNPRTDKRLFTPIAVPGHGAQSSVLLLYRDQAQPVPSAAIVNGNQEFRMCLVARVVHDGPAAPGADLAAGALAFRAKIDTFSFEDLTAGRSLGMRIRDVGHETSQNNQAASTCPQL
jgi:hypothetical protein